MEHTGTCSKRLPADVLAVPGIIWNILEPAQNVCRQTFWLCQASYGTYWNLRKTSAGRRFGCARHHMKHTGTYAKRLPADVLRRFQYVPYDAWHSQNVCRQTFCVGSSMFHMMPGTAKTSAGRRFEQVPVCSI